MLALLRDRAFVLSAFIVATALIYAACSGTDHSLPPTGCAAVDDCTTAGFPSGTRCLGGYCIPPGVDAGSIPDTGPVPDAGDDAAESTDAAQPDDAPTSGT